MTLDAHAARSEDDLATAPLIERVTIRYISTEDRILVAGKLPTGQPVMLWMTQRLLLRVLPRLFQWLEAQGVAADAPSAAPAATTMYSDAVQSFAQHAAVQQLTPQAPVETPSDTPQHLVDSVVIGRSAVRVHVVFKSAEQALLAAMLLDAQPLRQWLSIVYRQWRNAQWPMDVWPEWLHVASADVRRDLPEVVH